MAASNKTVTDNTPFTLTKGTYNVTSNGGTSLQVQVGEIPFQAVPDDDGHLASGMAIYNHNGGQIIVDSGYPVLFTLKHP